MAAAIHALIVGVSAYDHLPGGTGATASTTYGLEQLTAAARSAAKVRDWLQESADRLPLPIGSIRTLLSPSPGEQAEVRQYDGPADLYAVTANAVAWREDCATDPGNLAFCYVAAHGVQQTHRKVAILLEDFLGTGDNPLIHAIDAANLVDGLAPSSRRPDMARDQLWFFDTCRVYPAAFHGYETLEATKPFMVELGTRDDRCTPAFYASIPGAAAYAEPDGLTLFSQALLRCLDGAASRQSVRRAGDWDVTVDSLVSAMPAVMHDLNQYLDASQLTSLEGPITRPGRHIVTAPGVPEVRISLALKPKYAADHVALHITDLDGVKVDVPTPLDPNPYSDTWPAGVYTLAATPIDCGVSRQPLLVMPPSRTWVGELAG